MSMMPIIGLKNVFFFCFDETAFLNDPQNYELANCLYNQGDVQVLLDYEIKACVEPDCPFWDEENNRDSRFWEQYRTVNLLLANLDCVVYKNLTKLGEKYLSPVAHYTENEFLDKYNFNNGYFPLFP